MHSANDRNTSTPHLLLWESELACWALVITSEAICLTAKSHPEFQWPRDIQRSSIINQNVIDRNRHPYSNSIHIYRYSVISQHRVSSFSSLCHFFDFGTYYYGDGIQQRISLLPVTIQNSKLLFDNVVATLVKCQRVRLHSVLAATVPCLKHASHYFTFVFLLLQRLLRKLASIKFS